MSTKNGKDEMNRVARMIANANRVHVLSGAGMSAESGIDTFRGNGGFWKGVLGPLALAYFGTPVGWNWSGWTAWYVYKQYFYSQIAEAKPNRGHVALAELSKLVPSMEIITQNVDGLHLEAGSDPRFHYEIHGTVFRYKCTKNGHPYIFSDQTTTYSMRGIKLPDNCPTCQHEGCNSYIRPDCILFTESLPADEWSKSINAIQSMKPGNVLLVIGTSGMVRAAASLPGRASSLGAEIVELNLEPTESFRTLENYTFIPGKAGDSLTTLLEKVKILKQR